MLGAFCSSPRMTIPLYRTIDPYLASFLLSEGGSLEGTARLGPKTMEFCFAAHRDLHELLRLYWSGQPLCLVPARLFRALQILKRRSRLRTVRFPLRFVPPHRP